MRTTTTLAVAATSALIGLGTTTAAANPAAGTAAAPTVRERGILLECSGQKSGLSAYTALYENDTYTNYFQVILDDDPGRAASREPADILEAGKIRVGIDIAGKRVRVLGTAKRVGKPKHVHEEIDDAGQHVVSDGTHRRLAHQLVLAYDGIRVPLRCAPAFAYDLRVTKTDITGD